MNAIPELSKEFFCIVNRDKTDLAGMVSSYISAPGIYIPFFEYPTTTVGKVEGDDTLMDRHAMSRRRAYEFSVYVGNLFHKMGRTENIILVGLSDEQRSFLRFWDEKVNVIEIPDMEMIELCLIGFAADKQAMGCNKDDLLNGLFCALHSNARLVIDDGAPSIELPEKVGDGLIVIEDIGSVSTAIAVNYAFSVNANIQIVGPPEDGEENDIKVYIERWRAGSDIDYKKLEEIVSSRVGMVDFSTYSYCTFFTMGIPYSMILRDVIPFSYVHLVWRMDWFIFNGIWYEHAGGKYSAVIFSPKFFKEDEETMEVMSMLKNKQYFVKGLLKDDASAYNLDMHVKEYPYDLLHVCSHGGDVPGTYCVEQLVDEEGRTHTLEFDVVKTFHVGAKFPVLTKFYWRKYNGLDWNSVAYKSRGKIGHELFLRFLRLAEEKSRQGLLTGTPRESVPNSPCVNCADDVYQATFSACAGGHIAPFIFNNCCWSWGTMAEPFIEGGARCYIGTLWGVQNKVAKDVARMFYSGVFGSSIIQMLHIAAKLAVGTRWENVYIFWGLHFATLGAGESEDNSKKIVVRSMMRSFFAWHHKATTHDNAEIRNNSSVLSDWNSGYLFDHFLPEVMKLRSEGLD